MTSETVLIQSIPFVARATRSYATLALLLTDVCALLLSVGVSVGIKALASGGLNVLPYLQLWPFLFVFLAVYAAIGLYSSVAVSAPEELRRTTIASAVLYFFLAAVTMSVRGANQRFTWTLFLAMALSIGMIPMLRAFTRQLFGSAKWWGTPAVIFGAGPAGEAVIRALTNDPGLGLKPIAAFDEETFGHHEFAGIPVLRLNALRRFVAELKRPAYAVFAMPDIPQERLAQMIEQYASNFSHVLVLPDLKGFSSLWVDSKSVGGMVCLEVRQQIIARDYEIVKRVIDVTLVTLGSILVAPLCALIALWIRVDSFGPVLYSQWRIGRRGHKFRAWKFRSMVPNADQILKQHLSSDPALQAEWARDQKLRNDPRVTRSGRFLRRSSLDELPQLWNVLMGDMSLVGPRPIVEKEAERYGDAFETYKRVKGGITGLWQVSGRNDVSYAERVNLDQFYVRNWSVWLDFCILFRTIAVVLFNKGAY